LGGSSLKRDQLFEQASAALHALGLNEEICVCPICCAAFGRDALGERVLTLEHVPPKSIGGKEIVLTCKSCNNYAGTQYDNQPKQRARFESAAKAIMPGKTEGSGNFLLELGGITVRAAMVSDGIKKSFNLSNQHNDPRTLQAFRDYLARNSKGANLTVKHKSNFVPRREKISHLKTTFLTLSAKFGYSFALHYELSSVRKQLLNAHEDHHEHIEVSCPDMPRRMIAVDEKHSLALVRFNGPTHVLPWINADYRNFEFHKSRNFKMNISGKLFSLPRSFEALLDFAGTLRGLLTFDPPKR
jgi:hypothetical protein